MEEKYYILVFDNNKEGQRMKSELLHFPNGTYFKNPPIYCEPSGRWWVSWASVRCEDISLPGVSLIPTDVTVKMSIPNVDDDYIDALFRPYI